MSIHNAPDETQEEEDAHEFHCTSVRSSSMHEHFHDHDPDQTRRADGRRILQSRKACPFERQIRDVQKIEARYSSIMSSCSNPQRCALKDVGLDGATQDRHDT